MGIGSLAHARGLWTQGILRAVESSRAWPCKVRLELIQGWVVPSLPREAGGVGRPLRSSAHLHLGRAGHPHARLSRLRKLWPRRP